MPLIWLGLFGKSFNLGAISGGFDPSAIFGQLPPQVLQYIDLNQMNQSIANATQGALLNLFGTTDYFSYMAAGMTTVIVLFTVMFAGMSIVWERRFGFLNKLLVSPIPRSSIILSKVFGGVFRAMFQAAIVLVIAILLGLQLHANFSITDILVIFAALALLSFGLSSLFIAIATMIKKQETLMAAINLLNLPLMFASSALFPVSMMPSWLQGIAGANPISFAADAVRSSLFGTAQSGALATDFTVLTVFSIVFFAIGILLARRALNK